MIEYPALIYKSKKNNHYVANCIMKNIISFGRTEMMAINNLEETLNELEKDYFVIVKPVYSKNLALWKS